MSLEQGYTILEKVVKICVQAALQQNPEHDIAKIVDTVLQDKAIEVALRQVVEHIATRVHYDVSRTFAASGDRVQLLFLDTPLEKAELRIRPSGIQALNNIDIFTVEDLIKSNLFFDDLQNMQGIGIITFVHIKKALEEKGLKMKNHCYKDQVK